MQAGSRGGDEEKGEEGYGEDENHPDVPIEVVGVVADKQR